MRNIYFTTLLVLLSISTLSAQYWQQKAIYTINVDLNVETNQFTGTQKIVYTNNSPDTLTKVFYHLYFNSFQPGSMMDVRSRTISDPDRRVGNRIEALQPDEIGYQKVKSLKQNGKSLKMKEVGTILEVELATPIYPGKTATFDMTFEAQVPLQIRRSGRDNKEEIRYSMTQWYPKMCEYDVEGWHSNPYIGREFHGIWGDFDVTITIDKTYVLGATGVLQNPNEVGHGYETAGKDLKRPEGDKLSWHFVGKKVHDFAWAADPNYKHVVVETKDLPTIHLLYVEDSNTTTWTDLPKYAPQIFQYMNPLFGKYPYPSYSIIQGGDGGMEYPMLTLITGHRSLKSLVGVSVHEAIHSWYQLLLGTNESKYSWMDEGFTSFASDVIMDSIFGAGSTTHAGAYAGYYNLVKSGMAEPMTTHADYYKTNRAYGINSYSKGEVLLNQLNYIMGSDLFYKGMRDYYYTWRYKHPTPTEFKRVMEKASGLELDWYFENWVGTINTIDYGIKSVVSSSSKTELIIERVGDMPMPVDLVVTLNDNSTINYQIPLEIMRGEKSAKEGYSELKTELAWPWVYPTYKLVLDEKFTDIKSIEIDPSNRMADVDRGNNLYPSKASTTFPFK
ncbi:MAG: hypothetical protein ACJAZ3_001554 [Sphingobacteriales bacterium]|jgi:hypothetical protein